MEGTEGNLSFWAHNLKVAGSNPLPATKPNAHVALVGRVAFPAVRCSLAELASAFLPPIWNLRRQFATITHRGSKC